MFAVFYQWLRCIIKSKFYCDATKYDIAMYYIYRKQGFKKYPSLPFQIYSVENLSNTGGEKG